MADSIPPPSAKSFVSRVMSVKELIIAITSLLVAVASVLTPTSHKVTQSAYEEFSRDIQEVSSATARNHDDIVALRSYLDGLRGTTLVVPSSVSATPPAASMSSVFSSLLSKPPMPPFIGPKPKTQAPPTFEQIKAKK